MRYFMELQYNGGAYCGWQRQREAATVQGTIEKGLSTLLRREIEIIGAGRTDTGVHALFYVAHFDVDELTLSCQQIIYKLNLILPQDVAILNIYPVNEQMHARFGATLREYTYIIEPRKNPFTRHTSWQYYVDLDIEKMNEAAARLLEHEDFTSFAKLNSNNKNNICKVYHAQWQLNEDGTLCFKIRANRFLRNMVRAIVGTLVDVGRGRYSTDDFEEIIASRNLARSSAGAPASGLFLSDIKY
ncbi:MAG: tRNA pseudouridine(38-40) synthase TruA [Rikenellaceae bacterium]